jgi:hypothetical protein
MKISNLLDSSTSAAMPKGYSVPDQIKDVASKVKNTLSNVHNFITGGTRQQSYGYTSQNFFRKEDQKAGKSGSSATATPVKSSTVPDRVPNTSTGNITEALDNMFTFLKKGHEENVRLREISQNFAQESQDNEDRRHGELMETIREFTKLNTATPIQAEKSDEGGFLDRVKDMLKSAYDRLVEMMGPMLNFMKTVGSKLLEFGTFLLKNPSVTSGILWAIGMWQAKEFLDKSKYGERMSQGEGQMAEKAFREKKTDFTGLKITKEEALNILQQPDSPGKIRDIESFGGIKRITAISQGLPDPGGIPLSQKVDLNTATNMTEKFKEKKQEVSAQQARTTFSQTDPRMKMAGTKIEKTVTPEPIAPKTDRLNKATTENKDLEMSASTTKGSEKPVIAVNNTGSTVNDTPMPSTATQRDDTPILERVMGKLKAAF